MTTRFRPHAARPVPARSRRTLMLGAGCLLVVAYLLVRSVTAGAAAGPGPRPWVESSPVARSSVMAGAVFAGPDTVAASEPKLTVPQAVVLGVVEGLTEFLPVSSTGHLTVLERLMGVGTGSESDKEAADAYAVVIQAGAILAIVVLYHRRLLSVANGVIGRDSDGRKVLVSLIVAFLPAAIVGFVLEKKIKEHLFGPWPVVAAWVAGGVALLVLSTKGWLQRERHGTDLVAMSVRSSLIIGLAQCLALWPGTSRSLVTIVAALLVGLSLSAAVEFSFLLGFVTLGAATALDAVKHGRVIVDTFGVAAPVAGFVAAFVSAVIAVRWMVSYLQNHSLAIFGWYRLAVAAVTVGLLAVGRI